MLIAVLQRNLHYYCSSKYVFKICMLFNQIALNYAFEVMYARRLESRMRAENKTHVHLFRQVNSKWSTVCRS